MTKSEIVNGKVVELPLFGGLPGYAVGEISSALYAYGKARKNGYALSGSVRYVVDLPHRKSFSPATSFYVGDLGMGYVDGAPLFAVEIRSEHDYGTRAENELAAKRADYFAAGTLVVWDVDLLNADVVRSYHADRKTEPVVFRRGDAADAEPVLPGWRMSVDDLFPPK